MKKIIYGLYDLANSSYSAIIITFVISTYFARQVVGDVQLGAAYWQWTAGVCGLLIAVSGPVLGSIADRRKGGLIYFLRLFTFLCLAITCLFWFALPSVDYIFFTLIVFLLSNYCYEIAQVFYNSLLKQSAPSKDLGKASGLGFGLGYLGTVPILLIVLYFFILPEKSLFNLDKNNFEHVRFTSFIVVVWFLIFSIPMLFKFSDQNQNAQQNNSINIFKELFQMIFQKKFTMVGKFLFARMLYADALIVLISGGGVFASGVFGYNFQEIIQMAIAANIVAFIGVIIGGYLNDKFSSKKIILVCITALILCVVFISMIAQTKMQFFFGVMFVSIFLGTIQSASRVMMTLLLDSDNVGKGFGLFAFSGRITSFLGPLLVGTATFLFSQRVGLLSCIILFILGFIFMMKVKEIE
jgi:UMF1 family MFS transporter